MPTIQPPAKHPNIAAACDAPWAQYLLRPLASVPQIGARTAERLQPMLRTLAAGEQQANVLSLLLHFPTQILTRRAVNTLSQLATEPAAGDTPPTDPVAGNTDTPAAPVNAPSTSATTQAHDPSPTNELPGEPTAVVQRVALVRIGKHYPPYAARGARRPMPYRIKVVDSMGENGELVFFRSNPQWLAHAFPAGELRFIAGRPTRYGKKVSIAHPRSYRVEEIQADGGDSMVYRLSAGLTLEHMQTLIGRALRGLRDALAAEHARASAHHSQQQPSESPSNIAQALLMLHDARHNEPSNPLSPARSRLVHDILFGDQLALALKRREMHEQVGIARIPTVFSSETITPAHHPTHARQQPENHPPTTVQLNLAFAVSTNGNDAPLLSGGELIESAHRALKFQLTNAQEQAVEEICRDIQSQRQMLRLLQGDVGSGKTVVAWLAMVACVAAGYQAVLLAPTTLLAQQHYATLSRWAAQLDLRCTYLSQRLTSKQTKVAMAEIGSGRAHIVVGTHAVFQDAVSFACLGLAVIDEQHRFGVNQRLALASKGKKVDTLLMSATPIPRSLAMSRFGDVDLSILDEKPPGRKPITTSMAKLDNLPAIITQTIETARRGERVYWVCPAIEENEELAIAAAKERFDNLMAHADKGSVALLHGAQKAHEQNSAREAFENGSVSILVATTMVEVGVDVPQATLIVIESAERFGLAQLHQLRGRVGRNSDGAPSTCILLHANWLSSDAYRRLRVICESDDGFHIAHQDLILRGGGELLGTRQSGVPFPWLYSPEHHEPLLVAAHQSARDLVRRDPNLLSPEGRRARDLLLLVHGETALTRLQAG